MKKTISILIALSMVFSFVSCGKEEAEDTIIYTKPPVVTEETSAKPIPTEQTTGKSENPEPAKTYVPKSIRADESAKLMGYQEGTYEFAYMEALSGISFYIFLANQANENMDSESMSPYLQKYFKTVEKSKFTEPYGDILSFGKEVLSLCRFEVYPIALPELTEYWKSREYRLLQDEISTCVALSFDTIADHLQLYAKKLLALPEAYPEYTGEFALTDAVKTNAKSLMDACDPVIDGREELFATWEDFYRQEYATVTATEEFDKEHHAVKIVLNGMGTGIVWLNGEYIQDYQYKMDYSGSIPVNRPVPMAFPITVYLPVMELARGKTSFQVTVTSPEGIIHKEKYTVQTDWAKQYSDAPLQMQDEFLHRALTDRFGGAYSERDLLQIHDLRISYYIRESDGKRKPNDIYLGTSMYGEEYQDSRYTYDLYFDTPTEQTPEMLPPELIEDLKHFHAILYFNMQEKGYDEQKVQDIRDMLYPYCVTENTWNSHP